MVSIIVINYNTVELTINAIKSVIEYCQIGSYEIIIIDNSPKKNNLEFMLQKYRDIKYFRLSSNIGFGNANNFALEHISGEFVFLLNSDSYLIEHRALIEMKKYLEANEKVASVGVNLRKPDLAPNISYGNFYSVKKALCDMGLYYPGKEYYDNHLATSKICHFTQPTDVDYLTAAAIMIKRSVIEEVGFFDPGYFLYYEDMDLCYRFKKAGYRNVILPHLNIVHIGGQSALATDNNNRMIYKEIERSKYLFLKKTSGKWVADIFRILMKIHSQYQRVRYFLKSRFKKRRIIVANS